MMNKLADGAVIVQARTIAGIPVLEIVQASQKDASLPLMIGYHGWTNVKESQVGEATVFAHAGYRVLLPDAYLHGDRKLKKHTYQTFPDLYNAIQASVLELPELVRELRDEGVPFTTVSLFGRSMGGITVSIMATNYYDKLTAVVQLIGSPDPSASFETFLKGENGKLKSAYLDIDAARVEEVREFLSTGNLSKHAHVIAKLPYFIYHGGQDDWVDVTYNRQFAQVVSREMPEAPFKYLEFPEEDHWVPFDAVHAAVDFLAAYQI